MFEYHFIQLHTFQLITIQLVMITSSTLSSKCINSVVLLFREFKHCISAQPDFQTMIYHRMFAQFCSQSVPSNKCYVAHKQAFRLAQVSSMQSDHVLRFKLSPAYWYHITTSHASYYHMPSSSSSALQPGVSFVLPHSVPQLLLTLHLPPPPSDQHKPQVVLQVL